VAEAHGLSKKLQLQSELAHKADQAAAAKVRGCVWRNSGLGQAGVQTGCSGVSLAVNKSAGTAHLITPTRTHACMHARTHARTNEQVSAKESEVAKLANEVDSLGLQLGRARGELAKHLCWCITCAHTHHACAPVAQSTHRLAPT
jgi:hypothetical protein